MKIRIVILSILFFWCLSGVSIANNTRVSDMGNDLQILKIIKEYKKAFSGNVSIDEISPEIALDLIRNPNHGYKDLGDKTAKLSKVFFWNFPIKTEWQIFYKEYYNDNGIINSRLIDSGKKIITSNLILDLFLRVFMGMYILLFSFLGIKNKKRLLVLYGVILLFHYIAFSFSGNLAIQVTIEVVAGLFVGTVALKFIGDILATAGVIIFLICGFCIGDLTGVQDQYLIFIFMVCAVSFLVTSLMKKNGFDSEKENKNSN